MFTHRQLAASIKYCITTVLYQRGVYEKEYFIRWTSEGADVYELFEPEAERYLTNVTSTIKTYLKAQQWIRVVLAIYNESFDLVERWEYNVKATGEQEEHPLQLQLDTLLRNIKSTSNYIKPLNCDHTFKILIYVDPDLESLPALSLAQDSPVAVPSEWGHGFRGLRGHYNLGIRFQSQDY